MFAGGTQLAGARERRERKLKQTGSTCSPRRRLQPCSLPLRRRPWRLGGRWQPNTDIADADSDRATRFALHMVLPDLEFSRALLLHTRRTVLLRHRILRSHMLTAQTRAACAKVR